ncbi:MAG TPA: hypothetical protein VIO11_07735, partial [Candidatus Methanoperedens sp.]
MSILIGYQFAEIKYFFSKIKPTIFELNPLFKDNQFDNYFKYVDKKFKKSKVYYFLTLLILFPFILLEIIRFWRWKNSDGPVPLYF